MYKIGVIGGMGPLATVNYYRKLVLSTPAKNDREHIDMVILNHASIPDRTDCIINGEKDKFLNVIKNDFSILNYIGVNAIAIPCNTSHFFYDEFKKFTDIPIINMVESAVLKVKELGFKKLCVFCTEGTFFSRIYEKYAQLNNVEVVEIDATDRKEVMNIIYHIKETNIVNDNSFNEIVEKYCNNDVVGIIACTELSLIELTADNRVNTVDALEVLVSESLKYR